MSKERPNVLLLFSDEHSFRCVSHRDDEYTEPVRTPALDGLAQAGVTFREAYCQMPLCTPSRLCLLTGRRSDRCNAFGNTRVLPPDCPTIADALGGAGYRTGLVGKMHLGGARQFAGFQDRPYGDLTGGTGHQWEPLSRSGGRSIRDRTRDAGVTEIPESAHQERVTVDESVAWIRERHASDDGPWFLTASFSRPHFPLTAPPRHLRRFWDLDADEPTDRLTEPAVGPTGDAADHPMTVGAIEGFRTDEIDDHERQRARAAYFACVEYLDEIIGDFLATLERGGYLENTVVIYTSDHGELAGEHGLWWKHTWHEAAAKVPLLVQTPAHRGGDHGSVDIDSPVGLIDLFPTICDLADVTPPAGLDGKSLASTVTTGEAPDRGPVVCDNLTDRWGEGTAFRMVRADQFKFVAFEDAPPLCFDLASDPLEQRNLADAELPAAKARIRDDLQRYVAESIDFETVRERRAAGAELAEDFRLDAETESSSGNCYVLSRGDVVDADATLYDPVVVTDDPDGTFSE